MSKSRARVKVKKKTMTRAEAAAQFERNKARQRRRQLHQRILIGSLVACGLYAIGGAWWLVHTGRFEKGVESANSSLWQWTADRGFKLQQVELTGRKHADAKAIKQAIGIEKGTPILALSLAEMKERLEAVPEVKSVAITRTLPGTLTIAVTERTPAAWWQTDGKVQLIDRDGVVLSHYKVSEKTVLPVVVGGDAPKHMKELAAILDTTPSLKPDVKSAVRVGARRWNIHLTRDITVLLPEDEPVAAWKRFAGLVEQKALLSKAIRSVDMRVEDRVFIMPIEDNKNPITLTGYTPKEI